MGRREPKGYQDIQVHSWHKLPAGGLNHQASAKIFGQLSTRLAKDLKTAVDRDAQSSSGLFIPSGQYDPV